MLLLSNVATPTETFNAMRFWHRQPSPLHMSHSVWQATLHPASIGMPVTSSHVLDTSTLTVTASRGHISDALILGWTMLDVIGLLQLWTQRKVTVLENHCLPRLLSKTCQAHNTFAVHSDAHSKSLTALLAIYPFPNLRHDSDHFRHI